MKRSDQTRSSTNRNRKTVGRKPEERPEKAQGDVYGEPMNERVSPVVVNGENENP